MGKRSEYDQDQAAGRLRVGRAAFRWAVASGAVPAPDAGPGVWSRAAVEAMDAEAIAAAMGDGPLYGGQAADRLAAALGTPNPPGGPAVVSVAAVREMVKARLLTNLSADPEQPLLHPAEVDALAARRDAGRLLAEAAPLGPDQAAQRLGVRRTDFDHMVRLGWIRPAQEVKVKFGAAAGGTVRIALYRTDHIDLLPLTHLDTDWDALRALGKGRRSPLTALEPCQDTLNLT